MVDTPNIIAIVDPSAEFNEQTSSPSTPGSGRLRLYARDDGTLRYKNDAGVERTIGSRTSLFAMFAGDGSDGSNTINSTTTITTPKQYTSLTLQGSANVTPSSNDMILIGVSGTLQMLNSAVLEASGVSGTGGAGGTGANNPSGSENLPGSAGSAGSGTRATPQSASTRPLFVAADSSVLYAGAGGGGGLGVEVVEVLRR